MRTLVISDLHLGNRADHDVLRRPAPRTRLLDALHGVDQLVLLGDLAELVTRNPRRSLAVAEPVLRALGARLGPGREVIIVPGNHDAPLVRAWIRAQGPRLTIDATVPPDVTRALAMVVSWLGPAKVRVHYPGVWLGDGIWATHGHYLNRHLIPESTFGFLRRLPGRPRGAAPGPIDYERIRGARRGHEPLVVRALRRPHAALLESAADLVRAATLPRLPELLMDARLAPVTASLTDLQMRHASIPAMSRVVQRLGVEAAWVVFGHVHRLGPLAGDRHDRWSEPGGTTRFINTGSWLHEPMLVDCATPPHPYWPGGSVLIEPGREPRALGLLDGLDPSALRPSRR